MYLRQLRIALQTVALQRLILSHPSSHLTHVHPLRIRAFTMTRPTEAVENPNFKENPLYQQLAANPSALLAVKEFGQLMKELGIEFSMDRPPSSLQLLKLLGNSEFRHGVQKLRDDLAKAGVDVNPENALEVLNAFGKSRPK